MNSTVNAVKFYWLMDFSVSWTMKYLISSRFEVNWLVVMLVATFRVDQQKPFK